jgi:hypothetical protein
MAAVTTRSTRPRKCLTGSNEGAGPSSNAGIFELYRQRAEELRRRKAPGPSVRLRAPAGVGAVQQPSGIHRNVGADGTVGMPESDAAPLLRAGSGEFAG